MPDNPTKVRLTKEARDDHNHLVLAIKQYMRKSKISQSSLGQKLKCSQSTISRWLQELSDDATVDQALSYSQACALCRTMGTTLSQVLNQYSDVIAEKKYSSGKNPEYFCIPSNTIEDFYADNTTLTNNIHDPMFTCWFGSFHCYFYSTISNEDICFHGILNIPATSDDGCCHVAFEFTYNEEKNLKKTYNGYLFLSKVHAGAYCILYNCDELGEMTFLTMARSSTPSKYVCCTVALVQTISGGMNTKHPCTERMILSRTALEGPSFEKAKVHLLLNSKFIYIEKEKLQCFIDDPDLPESFRNNYLNNKDASSSLSFTGHYHEIIILPEAWFKCLSSCTESEQRDLNLILRKYSLSPKTSKVKDIAIENDIFRLYQQELDKFLDDKNAAENADN